MFENIVRNSEALRQSAKQMQGTLRPAMKGCPKCRTMQMIASPALGTCAECGSPLEVITAKRA